LKRAPVDDALKSLKTIISCLLPAISSPIREIVAIALKHFSGLELGPEWKSSVRSLDMLLQNTAPPIGPQDEERPSMKLF